MNMAFIAVAALIAAASAPAEALLNNNFTHIWSSSTPVANFSRGPVSVYGGVVAAASLATAGVNLFAEANGAFVGQLTTPNGGQFTPTVVVDGHIIFAAANIHAFELFTQQPKWTINVPGNALFSAAPQVGMVKGQKAVFFISLQGQVVAVSATGSLLWMTQLPGADNHALQFSIAVGSGYVVAVTDRTVRLLNSETGALFSASFKVPGQQASASAISDSMVFVGDTAGNFYGLSTPTLSNVWTESTANLTALTVPAVSGGLVVYGDVGGYVWAFNAKNGNTVWGAQVAANKIEFGVTIDANRTVYVVSHQGSVYAARLKDGTLQASFHTGRTTLGPVVVSDSLVFVAHDRGVTALHHEE